MRSFKVHRRWSLAPSIFSTAFLLSIVLASHAAAARLESRVAECGAARESLTFDIIRKGKTIGTQIVEVYDCDGVNAAVINVDIAFRMALLRIKATQSVVEKWRDGSMISFHSERSASFSGDTIIEANRIDGVWNIFTNGSLETSDARLASSAYWTADLVHAEAVLNIDTGELIPIVDRSRDGDVYELLRSDGKILRIVVAGDRIVSTQLVNAGEIEISFVRTD